MLEVKDINLFYGAAQALRGVCRSRPSPAR
ncbi:ABC-type arginine transport system ATPase subunit [Bradyrhizobium sp. LB9.1b]